MELIEEFCGHQLMMKKMSPMNLFGIPMVMAKMIMIDAGIITWDISELKTQKED